MIDLLFTPAKVFALIRSYFNLLPKPIVDKPINLITQDFTLAF